MTENIWAKAATAAFTLLAVLAGWGLNDLYHLDHRVGKVEVVQAIWLTSTGHSMPTSRNKPRADENIYYASMKGLAIGDEGLGFAQKSMIRASNLILQHEYDEALKVLGAGLEITGLECSPDGDHLDCGASKQ